MQSLCLCNSKMRKDALFCYKRKKINYSAESQPEYSVHTIYQCTSRTHWSLVGSHETFPNNQLLIHLRSHKTPISTTTKSSLQWVTIVIKKTNLKITPSPSLAFTCIYLLIVQGTHTLAQFQRELSTFCHFEQVWGILNIPFAYPNLSQLTTAQTSPKWIIRSHCWGTRK